MDKLKQDFETARNNIRDMEEHHRRQLQPLIAERDRISIEMTREHFGAKEGDVCSIHSKIGIVSRFTPSSYGSGQLILQLYNQDGKLGKEEKVVYTMEKEYLKKMPT